MRSWINQNKPFLGICLGLQVLFESSEESPQAKGLGIFEGRIKRIPGNLGLKVPHIGWNSVDFSKESRLFSNLGKSEFFYFVHSYCLYAGVSSYVSGITRYGVEIGCAVERGNLFSVQFHPEKSGEVGIEVLRRFVAISEGERLGGENVR
jgi:glutamine amidotransferase